jgi:hypothetical protein
MLYHLRCQTFSLCPVLHSLLCIMMIICVSAACAGAGTGRAAGVAAMKRKWVAASKEDQASAQAKYPTSKVNWRRGFQ